MNVRDVASGFVLLALAGGYYAAATRIAESSLSDEVGPGGLPRALAALLAGLSLVLILRGVLAPPARAGAAGEHRASLPRALGLLAFGCAYIAVAPVIGYVAAIALLIAGVALYEGMPPGWRIAVVGLAGAAVYWLIFVKLLGVPQPPGLLF